MSKIVEINKHLVSYYAEDGETWLDGDYREIEPVDSTQVEYDLNEWQLPVEWAVDEIGDTDASEASTSPIPDAVPEHNWLYGSYTNPYTGDVLETTVRLTGDWTEEERAEVFRAFAN